MSHLPALPGDPRLLDVVRACPASAGPLLDHHEVVMRGESHLSLVLTDSQNDSQRE